MVLISISSIMTWKIPNISYLRELVEHLISRTFVVTQNKRQNY